jgi:hypothetical protein
MRRTTITLLPLLAVLAAACGSTGTNAVDGKVKAAIVAQQGRHDVSSVSCTDQAPPAQSVAGGGTVTAEHTCTVTFNDGQPEQIWAVHLLDLEVVHPVQLLYRIDGNATTQPASIDVAKSFQAEVAILTGKPVRNARCVAGSPQPPAGATSAGTPDHVCSARIPSQGRQRWAVRVLGSNVQLLFTLR